MLIRYEYFDEVHEIVYVRLKDQPLRSFAKTEAGCYEIITKGFFDYVEIPEL